jgi:transposase
MSELFWLSDTQWAAIEPRPPYLGVKPRVHDRRIISGILHRFREGLRWRALPDAYGPRTPVFNRFKRWNQRGLWQELFAALASCEDPPLAAMVDVTARRAHRSASSARKGDENGQAIGGSRGGARPRSTRSTMGSDASTPRS